MKLTLCQANGYSLIHPAYHSHTPKNNVVLIEGELTFKDNRCFLGSKEIGHVLSNGNVQLNTEIVVPDLGFVTGLRNQIRFLHKTAGRQLH
ncbi:hypothetical protein AH06_209 [Erwinia phage AH06]|nr:hypothetical protein AH06_209 [Erwinia phage AH06]